MFAEGSIVSFFFRLINFGALIAFFIYAYKKYMRTSITGAIRKEEQEEKNLIKQQGDFKSQLGIVIDQTAQQELLGQSLADKISTWRATCCNKEQAQKEKITALRKQIQDRMRRQTLEIEMRTLQRAVKPKALDDAKHDLEIFFSDAKHGQDYLRDIFAHIHKEAS